MNQSMCAILPAAQVLFGKNKVSIRDIAKQWKDGTVVIYEKPNGKIHFVAGSAGNYSDIGKQYTMAHDQTGASFGSWKVINQCKYQTKDDGTAKGALFAEFDNQNMDLGKVDNLDFQAPMAVFK
jgi:hypothetical protein